jgi:hypothetical protein
MVLVVSDYLFKKADVGSFWVFKPTGIISFIITNTSFEIVNLGYLRQKSG